MGIQAAPLDNNVMAWQAVIFGPDDTPWEGGTFKLLLEFTEDYPNKPPAVKFLSKLFHPNVSTVSQTSSFQLVVDGPHPVPSAGI